MPSPPLRFVTFLAPNMYPVYDFVARTVGARLSCLTQLTVGEDYDELNGDGIDVAFVCGLVYVALGWRDEPAYEPVAAPLLQGGRYGGKPVYYSDVIVRHDSPLQSFADLRGRSWCYNEPLSHSGYGITRYHLARRGETNGFFGKVVAAGWHERSIALVCEGEVDAAAIDSQVLAVALRERPELEKRLRVIESLGPSTIQPVIASRRLSESLRADLQSALLELHAEPGAAELLGHGFVERFVAVDDASYDDIRAMHETAEAAGLLTLK